MSTTDTPIITRAPHDLNQRRGLTTRDRDLDPVIAVAREAGRLAGERLARTPLSPRQRASIAALMDGGRR